MPEIEVSIVRITDESFPIFVQCKLVDARGSEHFFVEKAPVVSEDLSAGTVLPAVGYLGCEVESEQRDSRGRVLLSVTTARPWDIESTTGETRFLLRPEQVRR